MSTQEIDWRDNLRTFGPKEQIRRDLNGSRWQYVGRYVISLCYSNRTLALHWLLPISDSGSEWIRSEQNRLDKERSKRDCKLIWRTMAERRCRPASGWKSVQGLSQTKCKRFDCIWTMKHFCPTCPFAKPVLSVYHARIFAENPRGTALWASCVTLTNHIEPTKHLTVSRGLTYARIHTYIYVL